MQHLKQQQAVTERRSTMLSVEHTGNDVGHLKSEMMVQHRKFERLEYKEKRLQACNVECLN
jgi:hypothetical protein